jgi:hypothetical protein
MKDHQRLSMYNLFIVVCQAELVEAGILPCEPAFDIPITIRTG